MDIELKKLKNGNKKKILFLVLTLIMFLGVSLAAVYFVYVYNDERENILETGLVSIAYQEGNESIFLENQVPVIDDLGLTNTPYEFTVQNTSKVPINVKIQVTPQDNNEIPLGAIRYALYIDGELIEKNNLGKSDDNTIYLLKNVRANKTLNAKLIFWVDYYYETPGETFAAKIKVTGESFDIIYDGTTDASCFTTEQTVVYTYNEEITDEEVNICVQYYENLYNITDDDNLYENFCRGTGVREASIPRTIRLFLSDVDAKGESDEFSADELEYFSSNNILVKKEGLKITDYDSSCGQEVNIPKTLNDKEVIAIGNNSFSSKQLTSVTIPNSIINIGFSAFSNNQLTNIVIPNSVVTLEGGAFRFNQIQNVSIPSNIVALGFGLFEYNNLSNVVFEENSHLEYIGSTSFVGDEHTISDATIPNSVIVLYCDAFNNDVLITKSEELICRNSVSPE